MADILHSVRSFLFILPIAILLGGTHSAGAAFGVCNKTKLSTNVAIGYFDGRDWSSVGWWSIPAGACTQLLGSTLNARYYYLYAAHEDANDAWEGSRSFCVAQKGNFTIAGRQDCVTRGFSRKSFFQVDTGKAADWTENLSDSTTPAGP